MSFQKIVSTEFARPRVSVLMLTYNHENFLAEALESALLQLTNFDFEIVVADDCSRDCTSAIAQQFAIRHPGRIRVLRASQRMGMAANFACGLATCRGECIALLEGDDFWTCPRKLQQQVDYLDSHDECSMAFHFVELAGGPNSGSQFPEVAPARVTLEDLLLENVIPTCSVMFRRSALTQVPAWFAQVKVLDWPLFVLLSEAGDAGFIPQRMGAYRIHAGGVWSRMATTDRIWAQQQVLEQFKVHFGHRYANHIDSALADCFRQLAVCLEQKHDLAPAFKANWCCFISARCHWPQCALRALRLVMKIYAPSFYNAFRRFYRATVLPEWKWNGQLKISRDVS